MSFSDSVEKGKKGTAGKKKRERIDHVGVRSKHHSQHCSDKDLHQMSHVCKERITRPCAAKHSPTRQMSVYPLLMLICF